MSSYIEADLLLRVIQKQRCQSSCRLLKDADFRSCINLRTRFVSRIRNLDLCETCNNLVWCLLIDIHKELQSPNRYDHSYAQLQGPSDHYTRQESDLLVALKNCKL